jgi:hypothetical protein
MILSQCISHSVADPVPFRPLDLGSGIQNRFFLDPGSQTHFFKSLVTIICVKSNIILSELAQFFF